MNQPSPKNHPTIGGVRLEDLTGALPEPLDKFLACLWLAPTRGLKDDYRLAQKALEEYFFGTGIKFINVSEDFIVSNMRLIGFTGSHKDDIFYAELLHMFFTAVRNVIRIPEYYNNSSIEWVKAREHISDFITGIEALHTRLHFVSERVPEDLLRSNILGS